MDWFKLFTTECVTVGVIYDPLGQSHQSGHARKDWLCFARFLKVPMQTDGTDGHIDMCEIVISTDHDCGSVEWINYQFAPINYLIYHLFLYQNLSAFVRVNLLS